MAKKHDTENDSDETQADDNGDVKISQTHLASLVESIAKIAGQSDAGPIRQIPISKAVIKTPWNPTGKRSRPSLKRPTYLSGARLREILLSEEEITLLNKLKAGKYHGKTWVVMERDGTSEGAIDIMIPNKTQEQRIALKGDARDLAHLLRQIIAEQEGTAVAA